MGRVKIVIVWCTGILVVGAVSFLLFVWYAMCSAPVARKDAATIRPGMTGGEVVALIGEPTRIERRDGQGTWWYTKPGMWAMFTIEMEDGRVVEASMDY